MKSIEILSLPRVRFAHVFGAPSYQNFFAPKDDWMEITYISEGELTVECDEGSFTAKKGDIVCLCCYPSPVRVRAEGVHEHHTVLAQVKWSVREDAKEFWLPLVTSERFHTQKAAKQIEELICKPLLFRESPGKGGVLFLNLLAEIDRCNRNARREPLPKEVRYSNRAKEYVQEHLRDSIEQKQVADYLGLSPEYLCAVFKKTEGVSFIRYVNTQKLEGVKLLMEQKNLRLYEAALCFGYSDPNYVSRLYKKYYGHNITDRKKQYYEEE